MDKFGIFKLLNSFFNFYGQKAQNDSEQTANKSQQNTDLFNNLIKSLGAKSTDNKINDQTTKVSAPPHPLQFGMLNTINSHDAIIKRVKQKNPQ